MGPIRKGPGVKGAGNECTKDSTAKVFPALLWLAIGSTGARSMSQRPDNFDYTTLDAIKPRIACVIMSADDTYFDPGDLGSFSTRSVLPHGLEGMMSSLTI